MGTCIWSIYLLIIDPSLGEVETWYEPPHLLGSLFYFCGELQKHILFTMRIAKFMPLVFVFLTPTNQFRALGHFLFISLTLYFPY